MIQPHPIAEMSRWLLGVLLICASILACSGCTAHCDSSSSPWTQISYGQQHGCAVREDGCVECIGTDNGEANESLADYPDALLSSVSASSGFSCGLTKAGRVECWGSINPSKYSPPDESGFVQFSTAADHGCGVKHDGSVVCWGENDWGQSTPPDGEFTFVDSGIASSCGIRADQHVTCWGWEVTSNCHRQQLKSSPSPQSPDTTAGSPPMTKSCAGDGNPKDRQSLQQASLSRSRPDTTIPVASGKTAKSNAGARISMEKRGRLGRPTLQLENSHLYQLATTPHVRLESMDRFPAGAYACGTGVIWSRCSSTSTGRMTSNSSLKLTGAGWLERPGGIGFDQDLRDPGHRAFGLPQLKLGC